MKKQIRIGFGSGCRISQKKLRMMQKKIKIIILRKKKWKSLQEDLSNDYGKYSLNPDWKNRIQRKNSLALNDKEDIRLSEIINSSESLVLGAERVRVYGDHYVFTTPQKHIILVMLGNVWVKVNSTLNQIVNKILIAKY